MKLQQITTLSTVRAELVEAQGSNGLGFDPTKGLRAIARTANLLQLHKELVSYCS